ncbi:MAG: GGDEF domain-containing protein [Spirochaetaceae bacterium]|nr:MAG: GGDEF domain-containing protein [Spirochaetaceae bacterium]
MNIAQQRLAQLEQKLSFQPQSGLPTHFRLELELEEFVQRFSRRQEPGSNDLQGFTVLILQLGPTYGMVRKTLRASISEWILYQTGCRIAAFLSDRDRVFHTREDEFVLLLPGKKGSSLQELLQSLHASLAVPHSFTGFSVSVSVTSGASYFPEHGLNRSELMHHADLAAGAAKDRHKPFVLFRQSIRETAVERMELQNSILKAIEAPALHQLGEQFRLLYQPKLFVSSLHEGRLHISRIEAEALMRWNHPTKGLIPPSQFIPIAEESGLIEPLGKWLLYACAGLLEGWSETGHGDIGLSVNLSPRQFRSSSILHTFENALSSSGTILNRLTVELTETSLFEDIESTTRILERFAAVGLRISVDDFGSGYSSLSHLHRFPLDEIKVDRLFVEHIRTNKQDRVIVGSLVHMAKDLGFDLIVEGVEDAESLQILYDMGCRGFQGFVFSEALSEDEFLSFHDTIVANDMFMQLPSAPTYES